MKKISIKTEQINLEAELYDTPTAKIIYDSIPLRGMAGVWGDEVYFDMGIAIEMEDDAREEVKIGELGYWPSGNAFCIFFGPTPVSDGEEPLAYSPVNVFGKVIGDTTVLKSIEPGDIITIDKV